jgi:HSP20 family protein
MTEQKQVQGKDITQVTPRVDIMETESNVYLVAEMPGVGENGVDIDLQGNTLTIRGNTEAREQCDCKLAKAEFYMNKSYERQFTLGNTIDAAAITATMKDGILRLNLPKLKELAPRKIQVQAG